MTNAEAISRIKFLLDVGGSDRFTSSDKEALNMAINALSECKNPKTNGDKIRAMSDSELANMLSSIWICHQFDCCEKCPLAEAEHCTANGVKQWLKQETIEDGQSENPATV